MSTQSFQRRKNAADLMRLKGQTPLVCLTAYDAPTAKILDPHVDLLLVGDSMGMVVYGLPSTLSVTLDMMIAHGAAVVRGSSAACVVVDMPFATYQESPQVAYRNAARIMAETGCSAIKLEGGEEMADTVHFLTQRGIPVVGHIGVMPQSLNALDGYRSRGKTAVDSDKLRRDAHAVDNAGAFAIVFEGIIEPLARELSPSLHALTIGIGASAACDGQILVTPDMVGLFTEFTPKFVKRYADVHQTICDAVAGYAKEVRAREFPGPEHIFAAPAAVRQGQS
jgi:3-methyl-2-oxobutanoate hydroxymethyltransferase